MKYLVLYQDYTTKVVEAANASKAAVKAKIKWELPKEGEKMILAVDEVK